MTLEEIKAIIKEKVVGQWVPEHTDTRHYYRHVPSGTLVSSVTTKNIVDKAHLPPWAAKMAIEWMDQSGRWEKYQEAKKNLTANEYLQGAILAHTAIRDDAGGVGLAVHDIASNFIIQWSQTGTKPADITTFIPEGSKSDGRVWAGVRSVQKLFDDRPNVVPLASELLVGSLALNAAGTLDLLVLNNNELEVWDFKVANSIDTFGYSLQIAAYSSMFTSMTKLRPKAWRVVKISKDYDKVDIYRLVGYPKAVQCFRALSKVFDLKEAQEFTLEKDVRKIVL